MQSWWGVFPGSEKLDLGERQPVALFKFKQHAELFSEKYEGYADVEPMSIFETSEEAEFLDGAEYIW